MVKDEKYHDSWNRSFMNQARAQDLSDILDDTYVPRTQKDIELFKDKQKFLYAVLETKVRTDHGKAFVREHQADFDAQDTVVLAVCSASPAKLKESTVLGQDKVTFLSDTAHGNARRFSSYDDFEEIELHSTILIDKTGCVRWKRTGGDPFTNIDFLVNELKRINGSK